MKQETVRSKEARERKGLQLAFDLACSTLELDFDEGVIEPRTITKRVWTCISIGAQAKFGLWYSKREIIRIPILNDGNGTLHLTVEGDLVRAPDAHLIDPNRSQLLWTKDQRFRGSYTNEDLRQMIAGIEHLYYFYP